MIDATQKLVQLADLVIDVPARKVRRDGKDLGVRGLTFDLLVTLLARGTRVTTLDQLSAAVWDGDAISNEVITQRVRLLRRALGDDPAAPRYVATARNRGYRLCAEPTPAAADAGRRVRWPWYAGAAVALVAALALWLRPSPVPELHDPLLERARHYASLGPDADNRRAIELYEQVLERRPDDYGARLGLSYAYSHRVCRHEDRVDFLDRARTLAEALLDDNANDAEATSALAYSLDCAGQVDDALAGYLRAYRLDKQRLEALASAAYLLAVKGELATALGHNLQVEAATQARPFRYVDIQIAQCLELMGFDRAARVRYARTAQLFPENLFAAVGWVRFLYTRGEFDAAREAVRRADELGAASSPLLSLGGELALAGGDAAAARTWFERAAAATKTSSWPQSLALVVSDAPDAAVLAARVALREAAIANGDRWPETPLELALLHWQLGDTDAAFDALRQAVDFGYRNLAYLRTSPLFAPLREHPGFAPLARRMQDMAAAQREAAVAAPWWTPGLLNAEAAGP